MGRRVGEGQWLAARQVSQGEAPTRVRVAAMLGVDPSHVYARAATEGWTTIDHRNQEIRGLYAEVRTIAAALSGEPMPPEGGEAPDGFSADGADAESDGPGESERGTGGSATDAGAAIVVPEWDALDPVDLLARASGFVARQIGRLIANADRRGGRLDKAQVEGLAALARMMDRWEVLAAERMIENKKKSDEELAEIFERINGKIVELAAYGARLLDEDRTQRRRRRKGGARMDDAGAAGAAAAAPAPAG